LLKCLFDPGQRAVAIPPSLICTKTVQVTYNETVYEYRKEVAYED